MSNAFTTPDPIKEKESSHKVCLDPDFLAESDEESDAEFERQMISFVENQKRKRKLEELEEEDLYSPPSMALNPLVFFVSEDHNVKYVH